MITKKFNPQLHKQMLIKILIDIFKKLNNKAGFKGGTCAYLFYDLPRISLDLDFDILKPLTEKDIDELKIIFNKHTEIKESYDKKFTTFFLLDYEKNTPNIKVELNKRIWDNNSYKLIWFMGVEMKIVDRATLLTNKIVALTNRRQPVARDLFDVYYLLQMGYPINEKLVRERTGKSLSSYLKSLPKFINKHYSAKNILHGLGELLDEQQKQWVKNQLIPKSIEEINKLI